MMIISDTWAKHLSDDELQKGFLEVQINSHNVPYPNAQDNGVIKGLAAKIWYDVFKAMTPGQCLDCAKKAIMDEIAIRWTNARDEISAIAEELNNSYLDDEGRGDVLQQAVAKLRKLGGA